MTSSENEIIDLTQAYSDDEDVEIVNIHPALNFTKLKGDGSTRSNSRLNAPGPSESVGHLQRNRSPSLEIEVRESRQVFSNGRPSTINKKISELGTKPIQQNSPIRANPKPQEFHIRRSATVSSWRERDPPMYHYGAFQPHDPINASPTVRIETIDTQYQRMSYYQPPSYPKPADTPPPNHLQTGPHYPRPNTGPGPQPQPARQGTIAGDLKHKHESQNDTEIDPYISPSNYIQVDSDDDLSDYKSEADARDSAEEDYDLLHAGYDIHDETRWKIPIPPVENDTEESDGVLMDSENGPDGKPHNTRHISFIKGEKIIRPTGGQFVWDLLGSIQRRVSAGRCRQKPLKLNTDPEYGRRRYVESAMHKEASFKIAPGAINRIEQHSGWLAIAASRTGGQADDPHEEPRDPDPYNDLGSLLTWNGQCHILPGHSRAKRTGRWDEDGDEIYMDKHYTVNDIKFNNSGSCFVSLGMDKRAKFWRKKEEGYTEDDQLGNDLDVYEGVPYEVAFQPNNDDSNVVAVGVKNIYVYSDVNRDAHKLKTTLILASKIHPTHSTGALRWDPDKRHMLYASSEPENDECRGVHKAFDLNEGRRMGFMFEVDEAGDAMAINAGVLALATRGEERHTLRLFDVKRLIQRRTQEIKLEPSSRRAPDLEVCCMAYSPDGIYLALARSDNCVHVYDSRMLGRGLLHRYQHKDQDPLFSPPGTTYYGIYHTEWITTRTGQFHLLSGGNDGCVRLWNPTWSTKEPTNGQKIVEVARDIGVFSVGDPFKGEYDLVVGDSSGEVTVFTGLLNYL